MIDGTNNLKQELYTFRGKTFYSDAWTIGQLNYALALNHSKERYEKVQHGRKRKD
jgi:hypothetical protein